MQPVTKRTCCYPTGCDREGVRLFNAPAVQEWLCEEHVRETLNTAAEAEADARRRRDSRWQVHLDKYLRENKLTKEELTEEHVRAAFDSWSER